MAFLSPIFHSKSLPPLRQAFVFMATFEIWLVGLLAATSFLIESLLPWAVVIAALYWPVRWIAFGRLSVRTTSDLGVVLVALMSLISLGVTLLPEVTYPQVLRLALGIGLFYAVANWVTSAFRLRWLTIGILVAGLVLAGVAFIGVEWFTDKQFFIPSFPMESLPLLLTNTINPNVMAGSLALFLPLALALVVFGYRQMPWSLLVFSFLSALAMGMVLVITRSRGALLAIGFVMVLLPLLRFRFGWALLLIAGFAFMGILYIYSPENVLDALSSSNTIGGVAGRIEIWSRAIYMIQDFPFTGIGMGSFMQLADLLYPFFLASPGSIDHAHNLLLQVAVDLGLPGLLGWLAVLLTVTWIAWKVYQFGLQSRDQWATGLGAGILLSQVAMLVHGQVDAVVWGMVRAAPFVWLVWGLAAAAGNLYLGKMIKEKKSKPELILLVEEKEIDAD
jgi:putative inorganic carbon (hco3(-)) transporter